MPNKSDYYRHMDPVTLATNVENPWRNPMKTGIVDPLYDATERIAWRYGLDMTNGHASNAPTNVLTAETDRGALEAAAGDSWVLLHRWDVTPGVKRITGWASFLLDYVPANIASAHLVVFKDDTTVFTLVGQSEALAAGDGADAWKYYSGTLATPLEVTLAAGGAYHVGIRFVLADTNTDIAVMRSDSATDWTYTHRRTYVKAANWNGTTIPAADVASQAEVTTHNSVFGLDIVYTSDTFIEFSKTDWSAYYKHFIPVAADDEYLIKFTDVVVADTKRLEVWQQDTNRQGVAASAKSTLFDCGKAAAGTNTLTHNGWAYNIADIGGVGCEGKKVHFYWVRRNRINSTAGTCQDVFWCNAELEDKTRSHSINYSGSRTTNVASFTALRGRYVKIMDSVAGAGCTIGKIEIGVRPVIMIGDSQAILAFDTGVRPDTEGWGPIWSYFTKPRIWVTAGYPGARLDTFMANYFASATPGEADLESFVQCGALWLMCGIGINDIGGWTIDGDWETKTRVAQMVEDVTEWYQMLTTYEGENIAIASIPPSSAVGTTALQAKTIRNWNRALLGIALSWRVPFYNPWSDLVQRGTESEDVPILDAAYTADGTHVNTTGGAIINRKFADAVELNTVDLRDAWD